MCYNCDDDAKKEAKRLDMRKKAKVAACDSRYLSTSTVKLISLSPTSMKLRFKSLKKIKTKQDNY